ncbi:MAG: ABC transporter permease [Bryobacteraceae bacterium]
MLRPFALFHDLRYGARELRKHPGFALVAVFSLALGIGAATAIFSAVYAVLIDPFPYADVDSLMSVKVVDPRHSGYRIYYNTDEFVEIAARSRIFDGVIASTITDVAMTGAGEPERLRENYGAFNTFQVMGVPPLIGRTPNAGDAGPGATPVAVLSYKFWQRRFGGDPNVLGQTLTLNGVTRTVIGVMPRRFLWRGADVWLPVNFRRGEAIEGVRFVHLLGRLKRGVTAAQANADLMPILQDLAHQFPGRYPEHFSTGLLSFKQAFSSDLEQTLWLLLGAVGLLLLIACANVANLLLARATGRQREISIRAALGATRGKLVRQLLTESLLLAIAGGVAGIAMASAGLRALVAMIPPDTIPDEAVVAINAPVLGFTVLLAVLTALLFGVAPAIHAARVNLATALRGAGTSQGSGSGAGSGAGRLRGVLVALELALSMVLLVGASLMIRTVFALEHVDLGFRPDHLLALRVPLPEQRYPKAADRVRFMMELTRRIETLPGVVAAGVNSTVPPFGDRRMGVEIAGGNQREAPQVLVHNAGSDYLRALGAPILIGRAFTEQEVVALRPVAVVNRTFVRQFLPTGGPIGRLLHVPELSLAAAHAAHDTFEIVGVVEDSPNNDIRRSVLPEMYIPFSITGNTDAMVVRSVQDPEQLVRAIRGEVYRLDKDQPVTDVLTVQKLLDDYEYAQPRFSLVLFSVFAGIGLTLAVVGVYSLLSYTVSRQTHEIGIRMALGAERSTILRMVLRAGLRLIAAGLGAGIVVSLGAARLLTHQIWGVPPLDPVSFLAVPVVLLAAGLAASYWPALRATRVDPMEALRYE